MEERNIFAPKKKHLSNADYKHKTFTELCTFDEFMVISRYKLIRFFSKNLAHVCAELIMRNEPPLTSYLLPKQNELRRTQRILPFLAPRY